MECGGQVGRVESGSDKMLAEGSGHYSPWEPQQGPPSHSHLVVACPWTGGHRDPCYLAMVTTFQGPTTAVLEAAKEEKAKRTKHRAPDGGVGSFWVVYGIDPQGDQIARAGTWGVAWQRRQQKSVCLSPLSSPCCPLLPLSTPQAHPLVSFLTRFSQR